MQCYTDGGLNFWGDQTLHDSSSVSKATPTKSYVSGHCPHQFWKLVKENYFRTHAIAQCWTTWELRQDGDTECCPLSPMIVSIRMANFEDGYTNGYAQNHFSLECATSRH